MLLGCNKNEIQVEEQPKKISVIDSLFNQVNELEHERSDALRIYLTTNSVKEQKSLFDEIHKAKLFKDTTITYTDILKNNYGNFIAGRYELKNFQGKVIDTLTVVNGRERIYSITKDQDINVALMCTSSNIGVKSFVLGNEYFTYIKPNVYASTNFIMVKQ